ncbi:hypothetical protein GCM10023262_13220 [Bartonella pachyuromydis]|uniref:Uncharacterized protein n=1 Tax=Bartonella pachyuromydis TaxID=931097 RepID=A0ABP8VK73_9HYPH
MMLSTVIENILPLKDTALIMPEICPVCFWLSSEKNRLFAPIDTVQINPWINENAMISKAICLL